MFVHKQLRNLITIVNITTIATIPTTFAMQVLQHQPHVEPVLNRPNNQNYQVLDAQAANNLMHNLNAALTLAQNANSRALQADDLAKQASTLVGSLQNQIRTLPAEAQAITDRMVDTIMKEGAKQKEIIETISKENGLSLDDRIKITQAATTIIAHAEAKASEETTKIKWEYIQKIIESSKPIIKIAIAIVIVVLCIYIIKNVVPAIVDHLTQPYVISETSKHGLLGLFKSQKKEPLTDLIFTPSLQKQLSDLSLRVQTAKKYDGVLPNVLFYGTSGTGKTAFVRSLAYSSGLDYALTSGSEFTKITNLNKANNELRKLLNWAKKSRNGLIVFIDEAESLFANRKFSTTPKITHDFLNTFLSLISDQSQKKVMFILATNHPFQLDDSIINRMGISIEFTLPEVNERERILSMYLVQSAQENEKAPVALDSEIIRLSPKYAEQLKGFSPRAIKFLAEDMIINARQQPSMLLTHEIAQNVIDQAKHNLQQISCWEKERKEWGLGLKSIHA